MAYPGRYRMLFALTAIPGALTVLLLRWAKEPKAGIADLKGALRTSHQGQA